MTDLSALNALGIELPGPAYIFGSILFGIIGIVAYRNGRKTGHRRTTWLGVALMFYPYATPATWALYLVGVLLCAAIVIDRRVNDQA